MLPAAPIAVVLAAAGAFAAARVARAAVTPVADAPGLERGR